MVDDYENGQIFKAMDEYEEHTQGCIKFVPRTDEANYIAFTSNGGCYSEVGMIGGRQELNYQTDDDRNCIEE